MKGGTSNLKTQSEPSLVMLLNGYLFLSLSLFSGLLLNGFTLPRSLKTRHRMLMAKKHQIRNLLEQHFGMSRVLTNVLLSLVERRALVPCDIYMLVCDQGALIPQLRVRVTVLERASGDRSLLRRPDSAP